MTVEAKRYEDPFEMLADIRAHAILTGHSIILADDPMARTLGFASVANNENDGKEMYWCIPLTRLITASVGVEGKRRSAMRAVFQTTENRQKAAMFLTTGHWPEGEVDDLASLFL